MIFKVQRDREKYSGKNWIFIIKKFEWKSSCLLAIVADTFHIHCAIGANYAKDFQMLNLLGWSITGGFKWKGVFH